MEIAKVIEVCAQVACGIAHEVPGRSVHELGNSSRPGVARPRPCGVHGGLIRGSHTPAIRAVARAPGHPPRRPAAR